MTSRHHRSGFTALLLGLAACASAGAPPEVVPTGATATGASATPPTASETVSPGGAASAVEAGFTNVQADRGRDLFRARCTECHSSGQFADADFRYTWNRRSAGDLYTFIHTSMPETTPGSLAPAQAADVLAYILRMNGFEPGSTELPADAEALDAISLASIRE